MPFADPEAPSVRNPPSSRSYVVQMAALKGISGSFQDSVLKAVSRAMVRRFVRLQFLLQGIEMPASTASFSDHV